MEPALVSTIKPSPLPTTESTAERTRSYQRLPQGPTDETWRSSNAFASDTGWPGYSPGQREGQLSAQEERCTLGAGSPGAFAALLPVYAHMSVSLAWPPLIHQSSPPPLHLPPPHVPIPDLLLAPRAP